MATEGGRPEEPRRRTDYKHEKLAKVEKMSAGRNCPQNCLEAVKEWNKTLRGLFAMTITQHAAWSPFMNEVTQTKFRLGGPKKLFEYWARK